MSYGYDKYPVIPISSDTADCDFGWFSVVDKIRQIYQSGRCIICIECYPGVFEEEIRGALTRAFSPRELFCADECLKTPADIDRMLAEDLSDDPVFGRLSSLELIDFFDKPKLAKLAEVVRIAGCGIVLGTGAALVIDKPDLLIYADLARWEIQQRQRRGEIGNFGAANSSDTPAAKYKRAFFVDWRVADRLKKELLGKADLRPEQ